MTTTQLTTGTTPSGSTTANSGQRGPRSRRRIASTALTAASFLLLTGLGIAAAPASFAGTPGGTSAIDRNSDFDGDGYDDILTGAPDGTVGGKEQAGYVTVQYGAANGLGTNNSVPKARTAVFSPSTAGVPGDSQRWGFFGAAVATGDIDADGYDDAVIGSPGEDVGSLDDAGRVTVLYGSKTGLGSARSVSLTSAEPAAGTRFGSAVTAARLTGATPGDVVAVLDQRGAQLFTYSEGTLRHTGTLDTTAHPAGRAIQPAYLTTGDYDSDGYADLVVSGYGPDDGYAQGWASVYSGGDSGVTHLRDLWGGLSSASGDINHDGYDDLVLGQNSSPDDEAEGYHGGKIAVYYGGEEGPEGHEGPGSAPQWWTQTSPGVPGAGEPGDAWGTELSIGDVDGDGYADVAVGAPGEDIGTVADAGAVWLLRGSADGVTTTGAQSFDQNTTDVPGTAEAGDRWGSQVRLADTNRDRRSELLAAAPEEDTQDGVVWHLPASTKGLVANGSWLYGAGSLGAPGDNARFGDAIDE
ncbi:esterase [Streptomyces montanus]|uniref:Esterase n=1 Tax=Streptomyces montanus TaxID=2580423 RepID=A0A5R9G1I2_9ACTN|nr:FG-GAP repeat protein [Streptomyces montanus]TLS48010.1 esterase [Streptomyces montanus]